MNIQCGRKAVRSSEEFLLREQVTCVNMKKGGWVILDESGSVARVCDATIVVCGWDSEGDKCKGL